MRLTRRQFLEIAAAAAAAAPFAAPARAAAARGVRVRHASIGASGMALADIRSLCQHPAFDLVAVADVDLSRVEKVRAAFPAVRVYQDWRELLDHERRRIDSVNVSTPDHMHAPIAMAAMRHGLHVYVQKPMAATLRETRRLTEAARRRRVVSQMGIQVSSAPSQRLAEALIARGAVGRVRAVHTFCDKSWGADAPLAAAPTPSPVPPTLDWNGWLGVGEYRPYVEGEYHPGQWRRRVGFGTGTLGDMGCHILSPPFRALGLRAPLRVTSFGPPPTAESWATRSRVRYQFPGGPLTAADTVELWWYDGTERPPHDIVALAGDRMPATGSIVVGTDGALLLPHIADPVLLPADRAQALELPAIEPRDHYAEFLDAVLATKAAGRSDPLVRPSASFDYAGPLTEAVLLGTVASFFPGETLEWDARRLQFRGRKDATRKVRRSYRRGWHVRGL